MNLSRTYILARVMGLVLNWTGRQNSDLHLSVCVQNGVGGEKVKATKVFLENVRKRRKDKWTDYGIFHSWGDLGMQEYVILLTMCKYWFWVDPEASALWMWLGLKICIHWGPIKYCLNIALGKLRFVMMRDWNKLCAPSLHGGQKISFIWSCFSLPMIMFHLFDFLELRLNVQTHFSVFLP